MINVSYWINVDQLEIISTDLISYPISLSQATQERFECVAEWDLSILEPQKIVQLEKIKEDLKKQDSDFAPLKDHIRVSSNLLYIL